MFLWIKIIHILLVTYCFVISLLNYFYGYYLELEMKFYRKKLNQERGRNYTDNIKLSNRNQKNPFPMKEMSSYFTSPSVPLKESALKLPSIIPNRVSTNHHHNYLNSLSTSSFNPNSTRKNQNVGRTRVFVLLPARNEAGNILQCLESLIKQQKTSSSCDSFSLEILVMDDDSSDGTFEIASSFASLFPDQVYVFRSSNPIPDDWLGKSYALHQLYQIAVTNFLAPSQTSVVSIHDGRNDKLPRSYNVRHPLLTSNEEIIHQHPSQLFPSPMHQGHKTKSEKTSLPFHGQHMPCDMYQVDAEKRGKSSCTNNSKPANYTGRSEEKISDEMEKSDVEKIYFLLTDADTIHEPESILRALEYVRYFKVHFFSGFPRQILGTWGEVITVPLMFIVRMLIPFPLLNQLPHSWSTFAIGQYMFISSTAFRAINGMEGVKKEICEDLALAKLSRTHGFRTKFLPIGNLVSCRMYRSYAEGFYGISKTIYPAIRSNILMTFTFIAMSLLTLLPFVAVIFQTILVETLHTELFFYLVLNFVILLSWSLVLRSEGFPIYYVIFWPLSCLNSIVMSLYSFSAIACFSGILWKDRRVK